MLYAHYTRDQSDRDVPEYTPLAWHEIVKVSPLVQHSCCGLVRTSGLSIDTHLGA